LSSVTRQVATFFPYPPTLGIGPLRPPAINGVVDYKKGGNVRNFLFLTCSTRTRTLRLPQTIPHTVTTSHTQGNHRLPHHPTTTFPFPITIITTTEYHQSLRPTNPTVTTTPTYPTTNTNKGSTQPDWNPRPSHWGRRAIYPVGTL